MSQLHTFAVTPTAARLRGAINRAVTVDLPMALIWCLLVSIAAQIRIPIPLTEVPATPQTLVVLLAGFLLPLRQSSTAMVLYLGCSAAGLPFFSMGTATPFGSTGGYIFGFVLAVILVGFLKGHNRAGLGRYFLISALGSLLILMMGAGWRVVLAQCTGFLGGSVSTAAFTGLIPFLPGALIKASLAATIARRLRV